MIWSLGVVCQEGSAVPKYAKDRPSRLGDPIYERFLESITQFRDLRSFPVDSKLCSDVCVMAT